MTKFSCSVLLICSSFYNVANYFLKNVIAFFFKICYVRAALVAKRFEVSHLLGIISCGEQILPGWPVTAHALGYGNDPDRKGMVPLFVITIS